MSTNTVNSQSLLAYNEMGAVRTTTDGLVSWGGVAMNPPRVYPEVPEMILDAPGIGYYTVTGPASRGWLDAWITVAAAGSIRDICTMIDASGLTKITLGLDATNHLTVDIWDVTATSVASFVATSATTSGTRLHVRLAWNSLQVVNSPLYVDLKVNDQAAVGAWTGGTSPWTAFVGTILSVGGVPPIPSASNPFNGTVENAQLGIG
jgi:hypothetical protein